MMASCEFTTKKRKLDITSESKGVDQRLDELENYWSHPPTDKPYVAIMYPHHKIRCVSFTDLRDVITAKQAYWFVDRKSKSGRVASKQVSTLKVYETYSRLIDIPLDQIVMMLQIQYSDL